MVEIWANVKTFLATEVPVEPCAGNFVCYEMASDWSDGGGVVVKGSFEVLLS